MARYSNERYIDSLYQSTTIIVGGKVVDIKEFKKQHSKAKKKKTEKTYNSITILPLEIKTMMKNVRVLKSLIAYYEHGYRQWGTIARTLMGLREIKKPFDSLVVKTKQSVRLIDKIDGIAKGNDKDVFQFVKKLSWKLEEVKDELDNLVRGINSSGVIHQFGEHECINGTGKRLGLRILAQRGYKAIDELSLICSKLDDIEERGVDVYDYNLNGKVRKI